MSQNDVYSKHGDDYDSETYHTTYQPDIAGSLPWAVISLVSEAKEKEPEAMVPLYEVVDPDALDKLFRSREARSSRVKFRYCGCEVSAVSAGEVTVSVAPDAE